MSILKRLVIATTLLTSVSTLACKKTNQEDLDKLLELTGQSFLHQKDALCQRVKNYSQKIYNKINVEEVLAIHAYTENGYYKGINSTLRRPTEEKKEKYGHIIELIKNGLDKLPDYKGKVVRFEKRADSTIKKWVPGKKILMKAFTSSSKKKGFTWSGNTKLHIESKNGKFIGFISQYPSEEEVLFKPYRKFEVTKRTFATGGGDHQVYVKQVQ